MIAYGPLETHTRKMVLDWARTLPTQKIVGVCKDSSHCLLANYVRAAIPNVAVVAIAPSREQKRSRYWLDSLNWELPPALNQLALAFDDLGDLGELNEFGYRRIGLRTADLDRLPQ